MFQFDNKYSVTNVLISIDGGIHYIIKLIYTISNDVYPCHFQG